MVSMVFIWVRDYCAKFFHFSDLHSAQDSEATSAKPVVPAVPSVPVGNLALHKPQEVLARERPSEAAASALPSAALAHTPVHPAPLDPAVPAAPDAETIPADLGDPGAPNVAQTASYDTCSIATAIDVIGRD